MLTDYFYVILFSSNLLSITIPNTEFLTQNLPVPKLSIAEDLKMEMSPNNSVGQDNTIVFINDDTEQASLNETASVASDLTRMCVSDEDEKSVLVNDDDEHTS